MYFTATDMDTGADELEHYGVQGMKWGIRKYVNYDGTLTAEGKRKYGTVENAMKQSHRARNAIANAHYKSQSKKIWSNKNTSFLGKISQTHTNRVARAVEVVGGDRKHINRVTSGRDSFYLGNAAAGRIEADRQKGYGKFARYAREVGRQAAYTALATAGTMTIRSILRKKLGY